jgi:folate-dependent phosphoribosylglycinamide formyltransferase PurN
MYQIGWFSTGRGPGSRGLLTAVQDAIRQGDIEARISFVFCNRDPSEAPGSDLFHELVRSYDIPLIHFSSQRFAPERRRASRPEWRLEYDRQVMRRLEGLPSDISVLAGYMLVVGSEMCQRYDMLNLHPAVPQGPAGTWQEVIWKLIETGADTAGAMIHLVTPELDKGPPVTYCSFSIRGKPFDVHWKEIEGLSVSQIRSRQGEDNPLFRLIRHHGQVRELPLITATIKAFSRGEVRVRKGRVVDASWQLIAGYDLSAQIDRMIQDKGLL